MIITNQQGFPAIFEAACRNEKYSRGEADITTTELIDSTMIRDLKRKHSDEIVQDVSDMVYSMAGQGIHAMFERAAEGRDDVISEKRFYADFYGGAGQKKLGGQIDLYVKPTKTLWDYKEKSVWWKVYGDEGKEEKQQNVNAHLMRLNGYEVERLALAVRYRDWQKSKANDEGYPDYPIEVVPVKLWDHQTAANYINERLAAHFLLIPDCTDEERWKKPDQWAVYEIGKKRAKRVLNSKEEALEYQKDALFKSEIEHRPGKYNRCEDYCSVSDFCPIWNFDK